MEYKLEIQRTSMLNDATLGEMRVLMLLDKKWVVMGRYKTVELPWLDNERNISCIPIGVYWVKKRWSPKHGHHLHILDVPGRTWILIHPGNRVQDIRGCILPGLRFGNIDNDSTIDVMESRRALKEILKILPGKTVIEIKN